MAVMLQRYKNMARFTLLYWAAVFAGILLWTRDWEFVRLASTKQQEDLFGLFAFCVFCVITTMVWSDIRQNGKVTIEKIILLGVPYGDSLSFLSQTVELSFGSWDYQQYEDAFRAVVNGSNPYAGTRYLYPPLFADLMAFVHRIGLRFFSYLDFGKSAWVFVFYIHQASLLYFLLLNYFLSIEFAKLIGIKEIQGLLLASALYLFNIPVLRTISNNQVNFYILTSILLVLILVWEYPFMAGVAAAVGGLIKLYPFALSFPLFFMKRWKALAGIVVGSFVIIAVETKFFLDFELWKQFFNFYLSFPVEQESLLFRNSSPMSLIRSTFGFLGLPEAFLRLAFIGILISVFIWFGVRFYQRETIKPLDSADFMPLDVFRGVGHLLDFSVISLFIAPSAWEHHYVIAVPLGIWVFALRSRDALMKSLVALVLVFVLPVFNIYPFSYLRMVGLIMLLILVSPKNLKKTLDEHVSV